MRSHRCERSAKAKLEKGSLLETENDLLLDYALELMFVNGIFGGGEN